MDYNYDWLLLNKMEDEKEKDENDKNCNNEICIMNNISNKNRIILVIIIILRIIVQM